MGPVPRRRRSGRSSEMAGVTLLLLCLLPVDGFSGPAVGRWSSSIEVVSSQEKHLVLVFW